MSNSVAGESQRFVIIHPEFCCAECCLPGIMRPRPGVQMYHYARNNGGYVEIAHGCEHYILDYFADDPPPRAWLEEQIVAQGADCIPPVHECSPRCALIGSDCPFTIGQLTEVQLDDRLREYGDAPF